MPTPQVTTLLTNAVDDPAARSELYRLVEDELRVIAAAKMRGERVGHTLQPTVLVNEAFMRLVGDGAEIDWQGKTHFYRAAAEKMRQILIDHARAKKAGKRPRDRLPIELNELAGRMDDDQLIALDEALDALAELDSRQASVVELHIFGGHSQQEVADILGVSKSTVKGDWAAAKAWLHRELSRG